MAASAQGAGKGAFGGYAGGGFGMVEWQQYVYQIGAMGGDFYAQRALSCGGQAVCGGKHGLNALVQP